MSKSSSMTISARSRGANIQGGMYRRLHTLGVMAAFCEPVIDARLTGAVELCWFEAAFEGGLLGRLKVLEGVSWGLERSVHLSLPCSGRNRASTYLHAVYKESSVCKSSPLQLFVLTAPG